MSRIDFIPLKEENINEIQELFIVCYPNKDINEDYWKWCFKYPYKYKALGLRYNDKLVGYYAFFRKGDSALCVSAMIHPEYRKRGLWKILAKFSYIELEMRGVLYLTLFSNELIHPIHKKQGFIDIKQIKEYRIPIKNIVSHQGMGFYPKQYKEKSYDKWRYKDHPLNTYIYYESKKDYIILSTYENRIQIVSCSNIERCIGLAGFIGTLLEKKMISFWAEKEFEYPFVMIPTWFMYKNLTNPNEKKLKKILKNQPLWMGLSDVY